MLRHVKKNTRKNLCKKFKLSLKGDGYFDFKLVLFTKSYILKALNIIIIIIIIIIQRLQM